MKHRNKNLRFRYKINVEDFEVLLKKQNNKCAICQLESIDILHVDHDHETGKIRGLLCKSCNLVLGHAKDDLQTLKRAQAYLRKNK